MGEYTPYFRQLVIQNRLVEGYNPANDRFTAHFKLLRQSLENGEIDIIVGEGQDSNHARSDLCDKVETLRHHGRLVDLIP